MSRLFQVLDQSELLQISLSDIFKYDECWNILDDEDLIYSSENYIIIRLQIFKTENPDQFVIHKTYKDTADKYKSAQGTYSLKTGKSDRSNVWTYSRVMFNYFNLLRSKYILKDTPCLLQNKTILEDIHELCAKIAEYKIKEYHHKQITLDKLTEYFPIINLISLPTNLTLIIASYIPANEYIDKIIIVKVPMSDSDSD